MLYFNKILFTKTGSRTDLACGLCLDFIFSLSLHIWVLFHLQYYSFIYLVFRFFTSKFFTNHWQYKNFILHLSLLRLGSSYQDMLFYQGYFCWLPLRFWCFFIGTIILLVCVFVYSYSLLACNLQWNEIALWKYFSMLIKIFQILWHFGIFWSI